MRFSRLSSLALLLGVVTGCSSSTETPVAPGSVALSKITVKHEATVLRFTLTITNTTAKGIKTVDSIEVDTGKGPKTAASLRTCDDGQTSPWLVKAGGNATIDYTLRSNGPDRQVVEAACLDASGKPANQTALWEFQTFASLETNGSGPIKVAFNGTHDDSASWTTQVVSSD